MTLDYSGTSTKSIDQCVNDVTASLKGQGFGVLGILDFKAVLKEKGVELGRDYKLLEICNPQAAKKALDRDVSVGLLLPCTIAIYPEGDATRISLLRPSQLLNLVPEAQLDELGKEIEGKLKTAVDQAR